MILLRNFLKKEGQKKFILLVVLILIILFRMKKRNMILHILRIVRVMPIVDYKYLIHRIY